MTPQKKTGSYYTPDYLAEYIFKSLASNFQAIENLKILEPSVGDGAFVRAFNSTVFNQTVKSFDFTGLDLIGDELSKAINCSKVNTKLNTRFHFKTADFLIEHRLLNQNYNLIVGNPPYISKNHLSKEQIEQCEEIHAKAGLSMSSVKNIWAAFLIKCCSLLTKDGILSFILPSELLQVKFSEEIRSFLNATFQRVEIFTFNDLLFECKGQDIVLLTGFKTHLSPGHFYSHIVDTNDLLKGNYKLLKNEALANHNTKWSHHSLSSDELEFIYKLSSKLKSINTYCDSKPGIVTAANNFFIVNRKTEIEYQLEKFTHAIIQKGLFVNGSVVFDDDHFAALVADEKPSKVLVFNERNSENLPDKVKEYLKIGESLEINDRYKCVKRTTWFQIPNISKIPQGFFFKRTHHYPKLLKNIASVLVTDSAYKIEMREGHAINDLVFSFYNSLTLLFAEIEGRYYGGGVLELTPSEFKKLPIPFVNVSQTTFEDFSLFFENKTNIKEVLTRNDAVILQDFLGLSTEEVKEVQRIYDKLINKRFRKSEAEEPIEQLSN